MPVMCRIFQDTQGQFQEEIRALYVETFSQGHSAQYIDPEKLNSDIQLTYEKGLLMVAVDDADKGDETTLAGALFIYPLRYDPDFNLPFPDAREKEQTPYIAELMVRADYRRQGLGRALLVKTCAWLQAKQYKEVFIRVWSENDQALRLYYSTGFQVVSRLAQQKQKADGKTGFLMEKVYLKKNLDVSEK